MLSSCVFSHRRCHGGMSFRILKHRSYIDLASAAVGCHPERPIFIGILSLRASPKAIVHEIIELVLLLAFLLEIDLYLLLVRALTVAHVEDAVAALSILDRWLFWADYIWVLNRKDLAREEGLSRLLSHLRMLPGRIDSFSLTLVHSLVNFKVILCLVDFTKDWLELCWLERVFGLIKVWNDAFVTLFHNRCLVQGYRFSLRWQVQTLLT